MPIPHFNSAGDLPVGIYKSTLQEITDRFGVSNAQRKLLILRLKRICQVANLTGQVAHIIVFGSFVTNKIEPNDVDVFIMMENNFEVETLTGESRWLFDHNAADAFFGASVFWLRRIAAFGGEQASMEDWQIKRDGGLRGILEVIGEN